MREVAHDVEGNDRLAPAPGLGRLTAPLDATRVRRPAPCAGARPRTYEPPSQ
ncbi:hypothetical protein [Streptomyces californicus]|uniref:hypothetical protein n=1 Tax=Streptomyces californicus TaxID=67351 RepID=UPI0036CF8CFA